MAEVEITLEAARVNAGLSKNAVSGKLKVSERDVSDWESGSVDLTIRQARELSRLYNIPIDNIVFEHKIK